MYFSPVFLKLWSMDLLVCEVIRMESERRCLENFIVFYKIIDPQWIWGGNTDPSVQSM